MKTNMTFAEVTEYLAPFGLEVIEDQGHLFVYRGEENIFGMYVGVSELELQNKLMSARVHRAAA